MATNDGSLGEIGFHVFGPVDKRTTRSTEDLDYGAQYVPEEVERVRQAGEEVIFVMKCGPCCWYWELPDGSRIFHCERRVRDNIARRNGKMRDGKILDGDAGPCPNLECGNAHTNGETVRSQ